MYYCLFSGYIPTQTTNMNSSSFESILGVLDN
jgi:hypothetical protein